LDLAALWLSLWCDERTWYLEKLKDAIKPIKLKSKIVATVPGLALTLAVPDMVLCLQAEASAMYVLVDLLK
jgi:hypothetical protein